MYTGKEASRYRDGWVHLRLVIICPSFWCGRFTDLDLAWGCGWLDPGSQIGLLHQDLGFKPDNQYKEKKEKVATRGLLHYFCGCVGVGSQ